MRVLVVTPPAAPVVSWADAKKHLRLSADTEKSYVEGLIEAATGHLAGVDGFLGRSLGVQVLEMRHDACAIRDVVRLRYGPVIELVSVQYRDADGDLHTVDNAEFELVGSDLVPAGSAFAWAGNAYHREAVRVRYRAGYEGGIPAPLRTSILLMVGDLYRNRETVSAVEMRKVPMSATVDALLQPFRIFI